MENYPILLKEYYENNIENNIENNNNFKEYLKWSDKKVCDIQLNNNLKKKEIPLTFYPIAKNIRCVSSYMVENILNNKNSFINNLSRGCEKTFWEKDLNRGNWFPWLWSRNRINGNYNNIDGWKYYFDSFTENHTTIYINDKYSEPPDNLKRFFIYLSCLKYTFAPNEKYLNLIKEHKINMNWPENKKVLAVQIRRGETCTIDGKKADRPYFSLDEYIKCIEKMIKIHNFEYIYISTDSDDEIDKIKEKKPEWKLLYLNIDRSNFFRMPYDAKPTTNSYSGTAIDLEDSCRLDNSKIPFIVDTGILDLYFIGQSNGYISTITGSEFSRCGWYLQIINNKKIIPYININDEPIDMNKRDILQML